MRFFVPMILATVALGGSFWLGHAVATRTSAPSLPEQAGELERMRLSIDHLTRSVSLLAVVQPQARTDARTAALTPPIVPVVAEVEIAAKAEDGTIDDSRPTPRKQDEVRLQRAQSALDVATQRGAWTRHDEDLLRELRVESPDTNWVPFMQRLASALNNGKVRPPPVEVDSDT